MLWQQQTDNDDFQVADDVQDLSFKFSSAELPVDHAWPLAQAIKMALPWIEQEPLAAIHSIHGAASGNGWNRPDNLMQLSKRTRLYIRLPKHRIDSASQLSDSLLKLEQNIIKIGIAQTRKLIPATTVFSRSICSPHVDSEKTFTDELISTLNTRGIVPKKILCGLSHTLHTPAGNLNGRSVLLADLQIDESIELQKQGIGNQGLMGCGIFLPHKSLAAVNAR